MLTHKENRSMIMQRNCVYCGKVFMTTSRTAKICDGPHYSSCPVCGKVKELTINGVKYAMKHGPSACSYECRAKRTAQTSMEKYGCKAPGNNPEARKKSEETMIKKFGVPHALMSTDVRQRAKEKILEIYGVDNVGKSKEIIEKRQKTNREKYGETMPFNRPECYAKQHQTMMERYNVPYGSMTPNALRHINHVSKINLKFKESLELLGCEYVQTEHRIDTKMYDLYIPETNYIIEIDPTFTHNSIPNHYHKTGLDKYYHRDKTQLAIDHGYKCVHIWDWDNKEIIARMLAPKIHLSCDEFQLFRLHTNVVNEFLDKNHYIGKCRGQMLCIGLIKDNEIYQVMTFGKPKFDKSHAVQLYRMCTKLGYEIDGGYDRLSKFASEFGLYDIVAYADFSKTDGSEYEALGMKFVRQTQPRLIWSKDTQYINSSLIVSGRSKYHADEELINDGWLPVYDCGQRVYVFQ